MEQQIHITLQFHLSTGKVNLNEIVYRLQKIKNPLMRLILENILRSYDDLIAERLSTIQSNPPSKARKSLWRHVRQCDPKDRLLIQFNGGRNCISGRSTTTVQGCFFKGEYPATW